ncbi:uncharacterized protein SCHCODRAFT_02704892 [Schizophyllum commune H4-8]|nr:uncharacterized protein SCHCODRAFT_02704892 [Schizophyllum commune H4-8]KAI5887523.1 hypothetical protein SCHCODRAFT_02704892 [Schizophyllum commune H4-8]
MSGGPSRDELKSLFAAADQAVKASAATASGQASKSASRSRQPRKPTPPKTLPRDELPPLSIKLAENTYTPFYRLGWIYTLREFVERVMKDPDAARTTSFENNVKKPFLAKYPRLPLPSFNLIGTTDTVIVYIASNVNEYSLSKARSQELVDAAKDILQQDEDPKWHSYG